MTDQHPITPPPELLQQWHKEACKDPYNGGTFFESKTLKYIATQAAQWGADTELEACCEWLDIPNNRSGDRGDGWLMPGRLRAFRRPKPLSLKEQALAGTNAILNDPHRALLVEVRETLELNRKALEALPND